jgi:hypothetical protein
MPDLGRYRQAGERERSEGCSRRSCDELFQPGVSLMMEGSYTRYQSARFDRVVRSGPGLGILLSQSYSQTSRGGMALRPPLPACRSH